MPPPPLEAVEILKRSEQGVCRPFLVRDSQDDIYVVKGMEGVGRASLVSELVCTELAMRLGLPVPAYGIMTVPQALIGFSAIEGVHELGGGPAFASRLVENATTLVWSQVERIDPALQQRVLVFDKWIRNGDRTLTERGGNVNLLWNTQDQLVVIDHNAAFEMDERDDAILRDHVFSSQKGHFEDMVVRAELCVALDTALAGWDTIINLLPEAWVYRDILDDESLIHPTLDARLQLLQRFHHDDFWRMI